MFLNENLADSWNYKTFSNKLLDDSTGEATKDFIGDINIRKIHISITDYAQGKLILKNIKINVFYNFQKPWKSKLLIICIIASSFSFNFVRFFGVKIDIIVSNF